MMTFKKMFKIQTERLYSTGTEGNLRIRTLKHCKDIVYNSYNDCHCFFLSENIINLDCDYWFPYCMVLWVSFQCG